MASGPHYRNDLAWIHHAGFSEFATLASAASWRLLTVARHPRRPHRRHRLRQRRAGPRADRCRLRRPRHRCLAGHDRARTRHGPRGALRDRNLRRATPAAMRGHHRHGRGAELRNARRVQTFVHHAANALPPGGLLLFDIAERESYPPHDERRVGGDDWSVIAIKDSDGRRLTRRVLTFRQIDGETRRDEEVHVLELNGGVAGHPARERLSRPRAEVVRNVPVAEGARGVLLRDRETLRTCWCN